MKIHVLLFTGILLVLPLFGFSQTKIYYNQQGGAVDSTEVFTRYVEIVPQKDGLVYVKEFNDQHQLRSEGNFSAYTDSLKIEVGIHKNYRVPSGQLWYMEIYKSGKLKELQSFYPNGKLKRVQRYNSNGDFKNGKCYQEDGSKRKFTAFFVQPAYPAGERELLRYLSTHVSYPALAKKKDIQGAVAVGFMVMKDGSVDDVKLLKGIGGGCDEEALRVVREMSRWSPGIVDDEPVKVRFTLPIRFRLQ